MLRFFIFLLFIPLQLFAQVNESFNDGNFSYSPQWIGNDSYFNVSDDLMLQLNDSEARSAYLATSSTVAEEASWQFRVKMNFNPSSSNLARVYLMSDDSDLTKATNAIYLELGNTDDNICLYSIENGNKLQLIKGLVNRLDITSVDASVKITRSGNNWSVESNLGTGWQNEGSVAFETKFPSNYFGVYCKYTVTRADKFFFDDIEVSGNPFSDKIAPTVTDFKLINSSTMQLSFSESLNEASISTNNFHLKANGQHPLQYDYDEVNTAVSLHFEPSLENTDGNELLVSGIEDISGNSMLNTSFPFSYYRNKVTNIKLINANTIELSFSKSVPSENLQAAQLLIDGNPISIHSIHTQDELNYTIQLNSSLTEGQAYHFTISQLVDAIGDTLQTVEEMISFYRPKRHDVVFNEWMADPSPSLDLPEVEYIEIYNTSPYTLSIDDWRLMVNDKVVSIPECEMKANDFICLVNATKASDWPTEIPTLFINNLPALSNSGFKMVLISNENKIIDAYSYQTSNIQGEAFKKDGGWSTERIDPYNVSGAKDNFHWCMDLSGGTPGKINSVYREKKDEQAPSISNVHLPNNQTLAISFSECMQLSDELAVSISPVLSISHQTYDSIFLNQLHLHFTEPLDTNLVHQLESIDVNDWANNALQLPTPIIFGVADSIAQGDLLINEVLFNPYPDGDDFVEIYNTSDKIIDLADLYFAGMSDDIIEKLYPTATISTLLLPKSYVAISTNIEQLKQVYNGAGESTLIETNTLPSFPDDEGLVAITNKYGVILDAFSYNEKMHFDLLKDKEGVSLERLSWEQSSDAADNWCSAASSAGFATPGYLNSQQLTSQPSSDDSFSLAPEVFTPNGDGMDDRLTIYYTADEPGATASIRIYSSNGQLVRYLVNNQSLSTHGYFTWDGLSEERTALQPGIYIIYYQCIYPSGKIKEEKQSCVISIQGNN